MYKRQEYLGGARLARVDGAQFAGECELVVGDVDRGDGGSGDLCILHGRMTETGHSVPERLDAADALVTGHERWAGLDRPVTVRGVDIGVAQAGRLQSDTDLAGAGLGVRTVLEHQRLAEGPDGCCLHRMLLTLRAPSVLGITSVGRRAARRQVLYVLRGKAHRPNHRGVWSTTSGERTRRPWPFGPE